MVIQYSVKYDSSVIKKMDNFNAVVYNLILKFLVRKQASVYQNEVSPMPKVQLCRNRYNV